MNSGDLSHNCTRYSALSFEQTEGDQHSKNKTNTCNFCVDQRSQTLAVKTVFFNVQIH